jgi:hypothetical protein
LIKEDTEKKVVFCFQYVAPSERPRLSVGVEDAAEDEVFEVAFEVVVDFVDFEVEVFFEVVVEGARVVEGEVVVVGELGVE